MQKVTVLCVGKLKEKFYITAAAEYVKRLGGYCRFTLLELPEVRLPEDPSPAEISAGLEKEAELITDEDNLPEIAELTESEEEIELLEIESDGADDDI